MAPTTQAPEVETTSVSANDSAAPTAAAFVEHVNITVSDPERTAKMLQDIFDWEIRWEGPSLMGGRTIHVGLPGNGSTYLAIYTHDTRPGDATNSYGTAGGLNHVGVVVADLDATEARILGAGYETHTHSDYEPGRRFYFHDHDNIEFEVVSYR
jgi:catechol 2,3-dioxygenase-like lactoylglutathione lyase family enzyme